mmetsp:Transcript_2933/g.5510  ORF Transcript_2933/g.5510 Transcript_2933/m.5510 type:complete len:731 (-) Transcript_2933:2402-4594(-)|eukprot:CAMPEP_0184680698 /NCGR_PEP_ID=MMETSP0312-20130426/3599_1 /TAXON_ID=31354 /ORGANISM="Compsopogon coeruleus, Strain SAG 36.94" /LENGTH=730 /DNA_ID=CAMNT_0027130997 /DNA_START=310 /DNA_END=2502 /DNA_ORIENTATION=-
MVRETRRRLRKREAVHGGAPRADSSSSSDDETGKVVLATTRGHAGRSKPTGGLRFGGGRRTVVSVSRVAEDEKVPFHGQGRYDALEMEALRRETYTSARGDDGGGDGQDNGPGHSQVDDNDGQHLDRVQTEYGKDDHSMFIPLENSDVDAKFREADVVDVEVEEDSGDAGNATELGHESVAEGGYESSDSWEKEQLRRAGEGATLHGDAFRKTLAIFRHEENMALDAAARGVRESDLEIWVRKVDIEISERTQRLHEVENELEDARQQLARKKEEWLQRQAAEESGSEKARYYREMMHYSRDLLEMLDEKSEEIESQWRRARDEWKAMAKGRERARKLALRQYARDAGLDLRKRSSMTRVPTHGSSDSSAVSSDDKDDWFPSLETPGTSDPVLLSPSELSRSQNGNGSIPRKEEFPSPDTAHLNGFSTPKDSDQSSEGTSLRSRVFDDVEEEYSTFSNVVQYFCRWRESYPHDYNRAYGDLSVPQIALPYLKSELCSRQEILQSLDSVEVLNDLRDFPHGARVEMDAYFAEFSRVIIPVVTEYASRVLEFSWDVRSLRNTAGLLKLIADVKELVGTPQVDQLEHQLGGIIMTRVRKGIRDFVAPDNFPPVLDRCGEILTFLIGMTVKMMASTSLLSGAFTDYGVRDRLENLFFGELVSLHLVPYVRLFLDHPLRNERWLTVVVLLIQSLEGRLSYPGRPGWRGLMSLLAPPPEEQLDEWNGLKDKVMVEV